MCTGQAWLSHRPCLTGSELVLVTCDSAGFHLVSWLHVQLWLSHLLDLTFLCEAMSSEWHQRHIFFCECYFNIQPARQEQRVSIKWKYPFVISSPTFYVQMKNVHVRNYIFLALITKLFPKRRSVFYAVKFRHFQYLNLLEQNLEASEQHW